MLRKQQIASAAIVVIAASFSFCCETGETELQAGYSYTIRPGPKYDLRRKQNDAAFLIETSHDLALEAQLAELAVRKATSPEVKEFAISVLTDHSIAIDEIQEMASRIDVALPEDLPTKKRQHYLQVAKKSGLEFDRAFCDFMLLNNKVALKKFERIVQNGNDEDLKNWAWGKLGIVKRHIAMSQNIEGGGAHPSDSDSLIE